MVIKGKTQLEQKTSLDDSPCEPGILRISAHCTQHNRIVGGQA